MMAKRRGRDFDDDSCKFDSNQDAEICWLCARPLGEIVEWHHPVPKSRGGKAKEPVHPICHRTIHANLTNSELERTFNSADSLRSHAIIGGFVDWIAKKPADFDAPTKPKR
jgi:hypothetical protein